MRTEESYRLKSIHCLKEEKGKSCCGLRNEDRGIIYRLKSIYCTVYRRKKGNHVED
jgi:hypothetical protein